MNKYIHWGQPTTLTTFWLLWLLYLHGINIIINFSVVFLVFTEKWKQQMIEKDTFNAKWYKLMSF